MSVKKEKAKKRCSRVVSIKIRVSLKKMINKKKSCHHGINISMSL